MTGVNLANERHAEVVLHVHVLVHERRSLQKESVLLDEVPDDASDFVGLVLLHSPDQRGGSVE